MGRWAQTAGAGKRQDRTRTAATPSGHGRGRLGGPKTHEPSEAAEGGSWAAADLVARLVEAEAHGEAAPIKPLSVRAQNALKELTVELTGEQPPKGAWTPSRDLLQALTAERLARARNCGPLTTREIVAWAQAQGIAIKPASPPGRSLPEMWGLLVARASAGVLTTAEVIEALEKSIRRRSVRIPIAFQLVLLQILLSIYDQQ